MVNKFEAIGIGISIIAMAVALFLIRFDSAVLSNVDENVSQPASIIVAADGSNKELGEAIADATGSRGEIAKMIVDDVIIGTGEAVKIGDIISVHYIGTLQNGQQFDNSYVKGAPFTFKVGAQKVIAGWDEGVVGMKVGGQRILVIPASMAYGDKGSGPIPGGATLVFAVELLSIN